jgi:hypothetical protein
MKSTINVPFTMVTDDRPQYGATPLRYTEHDLLSISSHCSESKARLTLRQELSATMEPRGLRTQGIEGRVVTALTQQNQSVGRTFFCRIAP